MRASVAGRVDEGEAPFPLALRRVGARPGADEAPVPVLLIDPRPLTRECTARWLEACTEGFRPIACSSVGDPAAGDGHDLDGVQLVVFNIGAAPVAAVSDPLTALARRLPGVPIVIFADGEEANQVAAAVRHGVRGYIPPSLSPQVVVEALRLVRAGGTFIPASVVAAAQPARPQAGTAQVARDDRGGRADEFTPRELEVLDRLRRGMPNKVIAYELGICISTVKIHIKHVMRKLGATNRTQAALLAREYFDNAG